jgi:hypothetical protein
MHPVISSSSELQGRCVENALIIGGEEIGRRLRMASGCCCWSG